MLFICIFGFVICIKAQLAKCSDPHRSDFCSPSGLSWSWGLLEHLPRLLMVLMLRQLRASPRTKKPGWARQKNIYISSSHHAFNNLPLRSLCPASMHASATCIGCIKIINNSRAPADRCVDSIPREIRSASPARKRRFPVAGGRCRTAAPLRSTPPPAAAAEPDWASDGAPRSLAAVGWWCRGNRSVRLCSGTRTSSSAAWVTLHCSGGAKATCLSATCTRRNPSCCSHVAKDRRFLLLRAQFIYSTMKRFKQPRFKFKGCTKGELLRKKSCAFTFWSQSAVPDLISAVRLTGRDSRPKPLK